MEARSDTAGRSPRCPSCRMADSRGGGSAGVPDRVSPARRGAVLGAQSACEAAASRDPAESHLARHSAHQAGRAESPAEDLADFSAQSAGVGAASRQVEPASAIGPVARAFIAPMTPIVRTPSASPPVSTGGSTSVAPQPWISRITVSMRSEEVIPRASLYPTSERCSSARAPHMMPPEGRPRCPAPPASPVYPWVPMATRSAWLAVTSVRTVATIGAGVGDWTGDERPLPNHPSAGGDAGSSIVLDRCDSRAAASARWSRSAAFTRGMSG